MRGLRWAPSKDGGSARDRSRTLRHISIFVLCTINRYSNVVFKKGGKKKKRGKNLKHEREKSSNVHPDHHVCSYKAASVIIKEKFVSEIEGVFFSKGSTSTMPAPVRGRFALTM